jgi:hypothetical protein
LNIALESNGPSSPVGGYWQEQMEDIWKAANATQNHVIMHYQQPTLLSNEFVNSEFALERVSLPKTTQACTNARRPNKLRCSPDQALRVGDSAGACDEPAEALQKLISTALFRISKGSQIPHALQSPAYDALKAFTISGLRIEELLSNLAKWPNETTKREIGIREVVCDWVVENLEVLAQFVPPTYPRTIETEQVQWDNPSNIATLVLGVLALLVTLCVSVAVFWCRNHEAIRQAQISFLSLLLLGMGFVSLGSIIAALPTSQAQCITTVWFTNIGYSLELVPLVVKLAALNRLMQAGRRFRRISVKSRSLYQACVVIGLFVIVFLIIWTLVDPPTDTPFYSFKPSSTTVGAVVDIPSGSGFDIVTEALENPHVVTKFLHCNSNKWEYWWTICIAWQLLLLLCSAVLAFQNREFRDNLADTRTLAMMIYSHMLFVGLRTTLFVIEDNETIDDPVLFEHGQSLLNSTDVLATVTIYFLPKFLAIHRPAPRGQPTLSFDDIPPLNSSDETSFHHGTISNHQRRYRRSVSAPVREESSLTPVQAATAKKESSSSEKRSSKDSRASFAVESVAEVGLANHEENSESSSFAGDTVEEQNTGSFSFETNSQEQPPKDLDI